MNARQQKFAECYARCGVVYQAAIEAGYSENYARTAAGKLLENVSIMTYIQAISSPERENRILSATERQELLSDLARDDGLEPKDRINAIDKLNKMTGEYTLKLNAAVNTSPKLEEVFAQLGSKGLSDGD